MPPVLCRLVRFGAAMLAIAALLLPLHHDHCDDVGHDDHGKEATGLVFHFCSCSCHLAVEIEPALAPVDASPESVSFETLIVAVPDDVVFGPEPPPVKRT